MYFYPFVAPLGVASSHLAVSTPANDTLLAVHNITRAFDIRYENLVVRANGQILATTTKPNASIYQIDPLGILPPALIHFVPNVTSACGITEGAPDIFYVASGDVNLTSPFTTTPSSYSITEIDVRGLSVYPNGSLTQQPGIKHVASLPGASLLNGIALARPESDQLLVADSFRGLIWNVNVSDGTVGVALNDSTTKGVGKGPSLTGVNGLKVFNDTMYWTVTGTNSLFKVPIDEDGRVPAGETPKLISSNVTCDDLVVDSTGNIYVASPEDVITRVSPAGEMEVVAGTFNSTSSSLVGPTAIRFGRLMSDQWSIYVTTNGGVTQNVPGAAGVSRLDLGTD